MMLDEANSSSLPVYKYLGWCPFFLRNKSVRELLQGNINIVLHWGFFT